MKKLNPPLPESLVQELRVHRKAQVEEKLAAGEAYEDWDLVFCRLDGRPISAKEDWHDGRDLLDEAGVREARVHDVRVVQQILGHSQLSQTHRTDGVGPVAGSNCNWEAPRPYVRGGALTC